MEQPPSEPTETVRSGPSTLTEPDTGIHALAGPPTMTRCPEMTPLVGVDGEQAVRSKQAPTRTEVTRRGCTRSFSFTANHDARGGRQFHCWKVRKCERRLHARDWNSVMDAAAAWSESG